MNKKIAILVDTALSIPKEYISENMYIAPLYINFKNESYKDMIDISPDEVSEKMQLEGQAKTSIPSIGDIKNIVEQIKKDGYKNVIAITLSSSLSGMYNTMNIVADEEKDINMKVFDTKNISLSAGFFGLYAQDLIEKNPNITLDELYSYLSDNVNNSKVFIYTDTLKYLISGGRIGKVMGSLGTLLKIMPIISCDSDGVYNTVAKVRNIDKAIIDMSSRVKEFVVKSAKENSYIAIVYKKDNDILNKFQELLKNEISSAVKFIKCESVTPAIGVHSGFGAIGVGVFCF